MTQVVDIEHVERLEQLAAPLGRPVQRRRDTHRAAAQLRAGPGSSPFWSGGSVDDGEMVRPAGLVAVPPQGTRLLIGLPRSNEFVVALDELVEELVMAEVHVAEVSLGRALHRLMMGDATDSPKQ